MRRRLGRIAESFVCGSEGGSNQHVRRGGSWGRGVWWLQVAKLFSAARLAVKDKKLEDVVLFRVDGSHVGFEDKLSLEKSWLTDNFITKIIFGIVDLFYYRVQPCRIRVSRKPNILYMGLFRVTHSSAETGSGCELPHASFRMALLKNWIVTCFLLPSTQMLQ
jgi:hypothetical protein